MNEASLRDERRKLVELRDKGIAAGTVRVILGKTDENRYDEPILNFGTEEPDVAMLARAILDKRILLIDEILNGS